MPTIIESINRAFLSILAFFAFIAFAGYFVLSSIDENKIKQIVLNEVENITAHKLKVEGPLVFSFWPLPTVVMQKVSLDLNLQSNTTTHLSASQLSLRLDPWLLLKRAKQTSSLSAVSTLKIDIDSFTLDNLKIKNSAQKQDYIIEKLSGHISGLNTSTIRLTGFELKKGKSKVEGEITFYKNHINGSLKSSYFNTEDLNFPIGLSSNITQSNFTIECDTLQSNNFLLNNLKFNAQIIADKITLSNLDAHLAGGHLYGKIIFNQHYTDLDLHGDDIVLSKLISHKKLSGGITQMIIHATGEGKTFSEIISTLTGNAFFSVKHAILADQTFQTSVSQMLFKLFHAVHSSVHNQKHTYIQCAALRLNLKNGIGYAPNQLGLETPEFNVWGSGHINLKNHAFHFMLYNQPKSNFTIEIGQFAKYVELSGTLENPRIIFNPRGLIQEGLSILAGIATGGISTAAEQLFKAAGHNQSACESVILKK